MMDPSISATITVFDFHDAKVFVTTLDDYVLLRIRTTNLDQPEFWLRMNRSDFAGFAAYLTSDAEQLTQCSDGRLLFVR